MSAYLLLRNNKESGPYSLNDLVGMGLKPYDLIWVQGKSAAWRYPCELEELKSFAPEVEEQPFDRFFKKPAEENKTAPKPAVLNNTATKNGVAGIDEKYQKYIPKSTVAVTLPGQKTVAVQRPVSPKPKAIPEPAPTISVTENPATAEVKYSQPLDDIKEMYVKTLQERKDKIARKGFVVKNLKRAAVIIGLVAVGVLAGFIIKPGGDNRNTASTILSQSSPVINGEIQGQPGETLQEENSNQQTILPPEEVQKLQSEVIQKTAEPKKEKPQPSQEQIRKETTMLVENQKNKKNTTAINENNSEVDPAAGIETNVLNGERNRKVRDDNTLSNSFTNTDKNEGNDNNETRVVKNKKVNPLLNFVSVESNNYTKVAFGGIRNLELTVSNDSKYILDKVVVELQYLKPSEQPLRTEMIQFRSIAPNEAVTKRIQDTNRGIKVTYKIIDIQSAQSETASAGF